MGFGFSLSDASIGDGFRRIAAEQIVKAIRDAGDRDRDASSRIHDVRRRCKKLRALLRLVRPGFDGYTRESARIRNAAALLSTARDELVLLDTLNELSSWAHQPRPLLRGPLTSRRPDGAADENAALAQFLSAMQSLLPGVESWALRSEGFSALGRGLGRTYRAARLCQRRARRLGTSDAFHRWRKEVKYLLYQLDLFEPSAPHVIPSFRQAAGQLAEVLGRHHDLALLTDTLRRDAASIAPGLDVTAIIVLAERRQQELAALATGLGNQLLAERPSALRRRFEVYWNTWQSVPDPVPHRQVR